MRKWIVIPNLQQHMFHPPTLWGISSVPGLLKNFLVSVTPKWRIPTKKDVPQTAQSKDKRAGCRSPAKSLSTLNTCQTHMMTPQLHRSAAWSYFPSRTFAKSQGAKHLGTYFTKVTRVTLVTVKCFPPSFLNPSTHLRRYVERCTSFGGHRLAGRATSETLKTEKPQKIEEKVKS